MVQSKSARIPGAIVGRPSSFESEIAAGICRRLAEGQSLRQICRDEDMPAESTVRQWVLDDREGFSAQYTRAREIQLDGFLDEILEIADDKSRDWEERMGRNGPYMAVNTEAVMRSKLRVDARKWLLAKLLPKKYGNYGRLEHSGPDGETLCVRIWDDDAIIADCIKYDLVDRLPPALREKAEKLLKGKSAADALQRPSGPTM